MNGLFEYGSSALQDYLHGHDHENGELRFLESIAVKGMIAVDVGSYCGLAAVTIAKKIGREGRLVCFEPVGEYLDILERNLTDNGCENVDIIQAALKEKPGVVDLYKNGEMSSIICGNGGIEFPVTATTLDAFFSEHAIDGPDLLSIDCEGSELMVLEGGRDILRSNDVRIFCEIHHEFLLERDHTVMNVVQFLRTLDYRVKSVNLRDQNLGMRFMGCEYIYAYK